MWIPVINYYQHLRASVKCCSNLQMILNGLERRLWGIWEPVEASTGLHTNAKTAQNAQRNVVPVTQCDSLLLTITNI